MINFCLKYELCQRFFITVMMITVDYSLICAQKNAILNDALEFGFTATGDFISNLNGGLKTGYTYIGLESVTLRFDMQKAGLWKNGELFLHGLNAHGKGPTAELTGDHQVLSNIEAGDYTGLYEFWYCQQIGKFLLLAGQHDLNSEFAGTRYGGTFINSSFGIDPSIAINNPISIYPVAAPCILLKYETDNSLTCKIAVYDGDPGNFETNRFNLEWSISPGQGFLTIGEVQYERIRNGNSTGTYKIGSYYHSGTFTSYRDTLRSRKGNYGLYINADQALFSRSLHAGRGLCYFLQAGIAPELYNLVEYYLGGGLRYHGILPYRYHDELGIAFAHISMGKSYADLYDALHHETAFEMTYKFQFGNNFFIQPSMQYIINPGTTSVADNCVVVLLRFTLRY
jgi:porin